MCNFCNGTHVMKDDNGPLAFFVTCPVCGPKSAEVLEADRKERLRRLEEARAKFKKEAV
ncbi:hypothetical protein [Siminovitchia fordii]|uniref:hypothetical protein n=1 Tax=Siminovitchia fordii TaxID=254759 RepID=UPI00036BCE84|nr:hypothetical protein [Siminovitchia fordii]